MSALQSIILQYQKMSRPMQWAALAALGLLLFFVWDQGVQPQVNELNRKADAVATQVRDLRSIEDEALNLRLRKQQVVWTIGAVRPPAPVAEGSRQFNDVVLEVLQKHGATNTNFSSRSRGKLPRSALIGFTNGVKRIDRLTGDIKFDASPEKAAAIIADLESSPHIEAITSLRLVRDTGRKVRVTLTIESWVVATDAEGGVA